MIGSVGKTFVKYVGFNIISIITASAMVFVDVIFVSMALGAYGLTAITLISPIYGIVFGLGLMLGEGGGSKYAANMAVEKVDKANAFFVVAVKLCFIFALPLAVVGIFFADLLSGVLGAQGHILPMVSGYIRVFLLLSPAIILYYIFECFVRNDGTPCIAMTSSVIMSVANILFDYIFIIYLSLGLLGAGLATSVSAIIAIAYLIYHCRKKARLHFVKILRFVKKAKDVFAIGSPSFVGNVLNALNMQVFNWLFLHHLGDIGVAAFGIVMTLSIVVLTFFQGIAQGMQPMASHYYGKRDNENLSKVLNFSLFTSAAVAYFFIAIVYLFTNSLISLFDLGQDDALSTRLVSLAKVGIRIYFIAFIFIGVTIVSTYFLTVTGAPKFALTLSILQSGGIIPFVAILSYFGGAIGIWLSYPIFEFLLAILSLLFLVRKRQIGYTFNLKSHLNLWLHRFFGSGNAK